MLERNTSNVFAAFETLMEEIEVEIDLINKVATSAMDQRDYVGARTAIEQATQVTAFRDKIVALRKQWETLAKTQEGKAEEEFRPLNRRNFEFSEVTRAKPTAISIFGQSFPVHTWRDVLEQTMNTIIDRRPEKFEQIMQWFPSYVGRDKERFRTTRKLKNGAFIEVNLSAQSVQQICSQVLESIGYSAEDLVIETR
jgi:hypothetical protein